MTVDAAAPKLWLAWIQQLNTTYTEITDIQNNSGKTIQPEGVVFDQTPNDPIGTLQFTPL